MKQKGTYAVCLLILVCLIGSAFYAPSLVMHWNDYQLLQDYQFQMRSGIDYEVINTGYTMDHVERLNAFAQGIGKGTQYYIASTGEEPGKPDEILKNIFDQEMIYLLQDAGILWSLDGIYDSSNITVCDHYVIYDNDSVDFLCWYLELTTEEEMVRVLVDALDHTVYYIECYHLGVFQLFSNNYTKDVMDWSWLNYDLIKVKQLYGDVAEQETVVKTDAEKIKSSKITGKKYMEERHEVVGSIQFKDGSLKLNVCVLNSVKEFYGFGIGIGELWDLLPEERKGECLVSFG